MLKKLKNPNLSFFGVRFGFFVYLNIDYHISDIF